jgi:hypothetical protein
MKTLSLVLAAALFVPALAACESDNVQHTTTAKKTWWGGTKVQDTTVRDNGNGNVSVDKKTTTINP